MRGSHVLLSRDILSGSIDCGLGLRFEEGLIRNGGKEELMHRLDHLIRIWEGDGFWRFLDDDVWLDMLCELEEW